MDLLNTALQAGAAYETGGASLGVGGALGGSGNKSPAQSSSALGGTTSVGGLTEGAEWNPNVNSGIFSALAPDQSTVQLAWLAVAAALVMVLVWKRKA